VPAEPYPRALPSPPGRSVLIDDALIAATVAASRNSPRGRIIQPLHAGPDDPLHRMLNVVQPGSYIRPHRHAAPPKGEAVIVLRGSLCHINFADGGDVAAVFTLAAGSGTVGIDVRPGVFHTFLALEPDTVVFEVKPGPYEAANDKDFAPWAPEEGSAGVARYLADLDARTR
jgi:cupin fold WbuC family metalloprotein